MHKSSQVHTDMFNKLPKKNQVEYLLFEFQNIGGEWTELRYANSEYHLFFGYSVPRPVNIDLREQAVV